MQAKSDYKINTDLLYGAIVANGYTKAEVADYLGITHKTFYHKMKIGKFGSDEMMAMVDFLEIDKPMDIFFPNMVT